MYRRDCLKIKALRTGNPSDWNNFMKLRNEVNNEIKNVKKSYYYETFEAYNGNSRKTWETINEVTRRKSDKTAINELELNGMRITNLTKIAEGFNKFFAEIGPELSRDIEEVSTSFDEYIYQTSNCFSFQRVTQLHVLSHLNKLCKRKATGLASVSARLLKECPDLISWSLALIFNQSINTGIFPDEWKNARIAPLFKQEVGVIVLIIDRSPLSQLWPRFSSELFMISCIIT